MQIDRKNMERITRVNAETETPLSEAVKAVQARLGQVRVPPDFAVGFGSEVEEQARSFHAAAARADPRRAARLRGDGVAVPVAARSVHHHVLGAARRHRRRARLC